MLWMYAVCALTMFVCLPFFMHYKRSLRYRLAALRLDPRCWVCFAALMLHAIADYLFEFSLFWGEGFFLAGHICYIAFFTKLFPVSSVHLVAAVCLLAVVVFLQICVSFG